MHAALGKLKQLGNPFYQDIPDRLDAYKDRIVKAFSYSSLTLVMKGVEVAVAVKLRAVQQVVQRTVSNVQRR